MCEREREGDEAFTRMTAYKKNYVRKTVLIIWVIHTIYIELQFWAYFIFRNFKAYISRVEWFQ